MKRMFGSVYFLLLSAMLAGCAADGHSRNGSAEASLGELPASFQGDLPCADCAGIRHQLSLLPDGVYSLNTTYLGEGEEARFHEQGKWSLDGSGDTLTLDDGEQPRKWRVEDASTLEALDLEGNEIESTLDYTLKRTDGFVTDSLENTYWKLIELDGKSIDMAEGQREPHLVLHAEDARVAGSTGCNRLMGGYEKNGDSLRFSQVATTMMACINGTDADVEPRFLEVLEETASYRVLADHLELHDADGEVLARFEVRHLT
ncbi:META domain-containing protein [Halomonas cupida]|uniref:META domain-containing protein n=1 Tax=Halomonas cupida TaxID=44933 RepID=UPI0039B610AC